MSDTIKFIIKISNPPKNDHERWVLAHGIPLDDVKAEIRAEQEKYSHPLEIERAIEILDNIGKAESEGKECKSE